jgi:hypothetical protein
MSEFEKWLNSQGENKTSLDEAFKAGQVCARKELMAKFPKYEQLPDLYHGRDGMYAVLGYVKEKLFGGSDERV